jgi:plastocyanin
MKSLILGTLVFLGVLAPLTFTPAQGPGAPSEGSFQVADSVLVRIEIEGDSVRAVPDVVTVRPGQRVEWVTDIGEWTVRFTGPNPFPSVAAETGIQGARGQRNGEVIRNNAAEGRYKYMIMVRDGERMRVRDPEVVVGPGDGPGR